MSSLWCMIVTACISPTVYLVRTLYPMKYEDVSATSRYSQAGLSNDIPQYSVGCNYLSLPEIFGSGTKVLTYTRMCVMMFCSGHIIWPRWIYAKHITIFFRVASPELGQSYDSPGSTAVTLKDMGKVEWPKVRNRKTCAQCLFWELWSIVEHFCGFLVNRFFNQTI